MGCCGGSKAHKKAAKSPLSSSTATATDGPSCPLKNPKLKVFVTRADTGAKVPAIKVVLKDGPSAGNKPSDDPAGAADFGEIEVGTYSIAAELTDDQKKQYKLPPSIDNESFQKGHEKTFPLVLPTIVTLRIVIIDRDDKPVANAPWTLSSPAKNGTTTDKGLIEVDISDVAEDLDASELTVTLPAPPPGPAPVVPPLASPPPYPPPITATQFTDPAPVARERSWKFNLTLVDIEGADASEAATDKAVQARLANLAFWVDGDADRTTKAVKAYETLYKKPLTGALASIKDDITTRHDAAP